MMFCFMCVDCDSMNVCYVFLSLSLCLPRRLVFLFCYLVTIGTYLSCVSNIRRKGCAGSYYSAGTAKHCGVIIAVIVKATRHDIIASVVITPAVITSLSTPAVTPATFSTPAGSPSLGVTIMSSAYKCCHICY